MLGSIHLVETNLPRDQVLVWAGYLVVMQCLNMTFANLSSASDGIAEILFKNSDKQHNFTDCVFENITSLTDTFFCFTFFFFLFFINGMFFFVILVCCFFITSWK
jgi:hypothetical protein